MPDSFLQHAHVAAAGLVCVHYLGAGFVAKMRTPFFESEADAEGNVSFRFGQRLLGVGETLFLLRNQPGFPEYVRRFQRDDLRATFFECMVARLFLRAGFTLSTNARRGVRGQDFDLQATQGSCVINAEVTALAEKPFSAKTLSNTIQSKRDQLPSDAPAVMFVVYPPSWVIDQRSIDFVGVANDVFSRTRRLNAVVFLGEEMPELEPGSGIAVFHVRTAFHGNPAIPQTGWISSPDVCVPACPKATGRRIRLNKRIQSSLTGSRSH